MPSNVALTPPTKTSPPFPSQPPNTDTPQCNSFLTATLSFRTHSKQWYGDLLAKAVCY